MHNLTKGRIGESLAIAKFLEKGFEVYSSIADINGTDLIVVPPNKRNFPLRIQVKSMTSKEKTFRIQRNHDTVDYYFLINTENDDFWIVPYDDVKKKLATTKQSDKIRDLMLRFSLDEWQNYKDFKEILRFTDNRTFRFHAGRTGKIGEKLAVEYFLRKGFEVYESVADEKGIDLVVKKNKTYYDVQVKYGTNSYSFRNIKKIARENYYYLFIRGDRHEFFFRPSNEVVKYVGKSGNLTLNEKLRK